MACCLGSGLQFRHSASFGVLYEPGAQLTTKHKMPLLRERHTSQCNMELLFFFLHAISASKNSTHFKTLFFGLSHRSSIRYHWPHYSAGHISPFHDCCYIAAKACHAFLFDHFRLFLHNTPPYLCLLPFIRWICYHRTRLPSVCLPRHFLALFIETQKFSSLNACTLHVTL